MGRTAFVVGATGLIGRELMRLLVADPLYDQVIAAVRSKLLMAHRKLTQIVADFDRLEDTVPAYLPGADVYCALGTTIKQAKSQANFRKVDYEYPVQLGEMAKRAGAAQYLIVTAMSADSSSRVFYNRVKGETEEALKRLELPVLQVFRPSLLLGERKEFRLGERIAVKLSPALSIVTRGRLSQYRPIQAWAVAEGMLEAARKPAAGVLIYRSDQIEELARQHRSRR